MFAVKNKDGLYYTKGFYECWTTSIDWAEHYTLEDALKSAERHNGKVVGVDIYEVSNGKYRFREKK